MLAADLVFFWRRGGRDWAVPYLQHVEAETGQFRISNTWRPRQGSSVSPTRGGRDWVRLEKVDREHVPLAALGTLPAPQREKIRRCWMYMILAPSAMILSLETLFGALDARHRDRGPPPAGAFLARQSD